MHNQQILLNKLQKNKRRCD